MKRDISKLFPRLYLFIALTKKNVYEEYLELKQQNRCVVSLWEYLINYFIHGSTPIEYNVLGFKYLNKQGKNTFITMGKNKKSQGITTPVQLKYYVPKKNLMSIFQII